MQSVQIQNTIDQILNPKPMRILYPYQGEVGVDLLEVTNVKAEEQHLGQFICDTHQQYDLILNEKYNFSHHLSEFYQRTHSRRYIFGIRLACLQDVLRYLDLEEKIVYEYLEILEGHRQTLEQLSSNPANINFGYIQVKEMPNLKTVQQIAHDVLDRMFGLHNTLVTQLIMPLNSLEMEFQQCIYSELAGFSSWQQDLQNYGQATSSSGTATIEEADDDEEEDESSG